MLLSLNEHCLIHLCKYLNLEDQLTLSRVCEFFKDFFEQNYWKWQCKKISLTDYFWYQEENVEYLPIFLQCAATALEQIDLDREDIVKYSSVLIKINFPKIRSVVMTSNIDDDCSAQLFEMSQIFPQIKELEIKGKYDGQHISLFKEVEELYLKPYANKISSSEFLEIFALPNLKKIALVTYFNSSKQFLEAIHLAQHCSTLEEIVLHEDVFFKCIMNSLKNIKKLSVMTVKTCGRFDVSTMIDKIEQHFGEAIQTLVFQQICIWMRISEEITKIKSLQRFVFLKSYVEMNKLEELCRLLPNNLEEFECMCENLGEITASTLIPMIENCQELRSVTLSGSSIPDDFIADIIEAIDFQDRKQPLTLHCFQTEASKQNFQDLLLPENLQVISSKQCLRSYISDSEEFTVFLNRANIKEGHIDEESEPEFTDEDDYWPEEGCRAMGLLPSDYSSD